MVRAKPLLAVAPVVMGVLAFVARARADGVEARAARAMSLFEEARMDMAEGHYAEACPKFADSNSLDPGAGTMLNLAYCYEKLGKKAHAWTEYQSAAVAAHQNGKLDWESAAHARAAQLETGVAWIVVHVDKEIDAGQLDIRFDGEPFEVGQLGRSTPVDPGRHDVKVSAVGKQTWVTTFEVDAHDTPTVEIPALELLPIAAPPPASRQALVPAADAGPNRWRTQRVAAVAVAGVGVTALAVASGFALTAVSTYQAADCRGGRCTQAGADAKLRAITQRTVAGVAAGAGAASLATAALLWWTASSHPQSMRLDAAVGRGSWALSMQGSW